MIVKLISITKPEIEIDGKPLTAEGLIAYCARVSSENQENPDYAKLLQYCIRQSHWSVFEMVDMTIEIQTTLGIAPQLLRHKSFCFQQHSKRYSSFVDVEFYKARRQDKKNRQNSIDDLPEYVHDWFEDAQMLTWQESLKRYEMALEFGIAKECARNLLPQITTTKMYMKGNIRSWIHYLQVRCDLSTQKEHRDIANAIKAIFIDNFPIVSKALEWC